MSTTKPKTTETNVRQGTKPDYVVKSRRGYGRNAPFLRVGAAWSRENGGICVRLDGTQLVENDLYLFPMDQDEGEAR